ncbi:MAG: DNA polymerase IV, partial [Kiritimatiellae bacterium]|nr:DNA polymerase IV [Kiritimatiellia bacterium]
MDAFFAAIEERDQPSLKGKPVVIGSPPDRRGVVSTANYEARKFG